MIISFVVKTNKDMPMINTATFETPDGKILTIDRDWTEYSCDEIGVELYRMRMDWHTCYIWDGECENYIVGNLNDDETKPWTDLEFVDFDIEDDAGSDYFVELESYEIVV